MITSRVKFKIHSKAIRRREQLRTDMVAITSLVTFATFRAACLVTWRKLITVSLPIFNNTCHGELTHTEGSLNLPFLTLGWCAISA